MAEESPVDFVWGNLSWRNVAPPDDRVTAAHAVGAVADLLATLSADEAIRDRMGYAGPPEGSFSDIAEWLRLAGEAALAKPLQD